MGRGRGRDVESDSNNDNIQKHHNKRTKVDHEDVINIEEFDSDNESDGRNKFVLSIPDDILQEISVNDQQKTSLSDNISANMVQASDLQQSANISTDTTQISDLQPPVNNQTSSSVNTPSVTTDSLTATITQQPNNITTLVSAFMQMITANLLVNLFIDECKILFIRIQKPTPQLILALARNCANHLSVTLNASDAKSKGRSWFATWRTRLYDDCLMIAFDFMDRYNCTLDKLPSETHIIKNFISSDDVINVFQSQIKKVKKVELVNDHTSWSLLKNFISNVLFIMVRHYVKLNVNRTEYYDDEITSNKRTDWRHTILADLHELDRQTVDVNVTCEGGTTFAKEIDIRTFMNW
ncbi:unnamed protein product [Rhizophagus irregularis]|uniref:Uncharacterized protein n=1 Tax=Rhizophagus irregularis TaxID=588596 RepID=A0A915Z2J8_9GLOM|nr:unnamed protein product [Rhizophagus irregularis]